jgi:nitrogen fixation/metabolism regulation signal transduction histidine kinase
MMSDEFRFTLKGNAVASAAEEIERSRRAFAESVLRTLAAAQPPPFDFAGLARSLEPSAASIAAVRAAALIAVSPLLHAPVADIEAAIRSAAALNLSAFGPYSDGCAAGRAIRATLGGADEVPGVM